MSQRTGRQQCSPTTRWFNVGQRCTTDLLCDERGRDHVCPFQTSTEVSAWTRVYGEGVNTGGVEGGGMER